MKKVFLILPTLIFLGGCSLKTNPAAINIQSEPKAQVFINNEHVGSTPYREHTLKPGDYDIKLALDSDPNRSWSTKVSLKPQLLTSINRVFGPSEEESLHYILNLDPLKNSSTAQVSIVTLPDSTEVKFNDKSKGLSPATIKELAEGDHKISILSPGYKEISIPIHTVPGYRLLVSAKLAQDKGLATASGEATESANLKEATGSASVSSETDLQIKPSPTPGTSPKISPTPGTSKNAVEKPYVIIQETGTGWLRVRSEPNSNGNNELAKVDTGKQYPYLKASGTGWYQIEYLPGKTGWIVSRYAKLVD